MGTEHGAFDEIVLPERKPALEWILGRAVQKVSPKRRHSRLQGWWSMHLDAWARGRGEAGPEWRFRVAPPGEVVRPLVPDVAYLSYARMRDASEEELEAPLIAPDAVVEIMAPEDLRSHLEHKLAIYLAAGTRVVVIVDPGARTVTAHDRDASQRFAGRDTFGHPALPGFRFVVERMFAVLQLRR